MTKIRPFSERDIGEVTGLYERVIRSGASNPPVRLGDYFRRTFLEHPWVDDEIPSLVTEDSDGRVVAFLGSHVRRFRFDGEPIRLACSGQLVTAPEVRHEAAGAFLLRRYMAGPQELTITDGANDPARRLWEALGGDTLHVSCIDWIRVFGPASAVSEYATRRRTNGVPKAARPVLRAADAVARGLGRGRLRPPRAEGTVEELTPATLVDHLGAVTQGLQLQPDYDVQFLAWLFAELAQVRTRGTLIRSLVRAADGRVCGWYVAYVRPGGVSDALQIAASERAIGSVIDHLLHEASRRGASAVRGRVEPRLLPALSERGMVLRYSAGALAHARSPEILRAIRGGRALLTRMDGEWWMGHHIEAFD
jgi:hypothetical protein